jgi:hypothetical protein
VGGAMTGDIWQVLGIPNTSDERTIKRAYATRLKVTNPEDDPDSFKALRNAYEQAVQKAKFADRQASYRNDVDEEGDQQEAIIAVTPETVTPPILSPKPPHEPTPEEIHVTLGEDLSEVVGKPATPSEILSCLEAYLASPQINELSNYSKAENFLADLIALERPAGEVMLDRCTAFFGWDGPQKHVPDTPAARMQVVREEIKQKQEEIEFLAAIRRPDHCYFPVLAEANIDPDTRSWLSRTMGLRYLWHVRGTFDYFDRNCPSAFDQFNPKAVQWLRWRVTTIYPRYKHLKWIWMSLAAIFVLAVWPK